MMAAKTTSAPAARILQSSYGPIGSGIPSRNQAQPIQRPNPSLDPMSLEQGTVARDISMPAPTTPLQNQAPAINGMMRSSPNVPLPSNVMTSGPNLVTPTQNASNPHSVIPNLQGAMQNQAYRVSMANAQGSSSMAVDGTPRSNVGVTPVRTFPEGGGEEGWLRFFFDNFASS